MKHFLIICFSLVSFYLPANELLDSEKNSVEIFAANVQSVVNVSNIQRFTARVGFWNLETVEIPAGTGTGYVWDNNGHIVTNYHVIQNGKKFFVTFHKDTKQYEAEIVGEEPAFDIAVIKLKEIPANLRPIKVGNSSSLLVGQKAIAIGNPFGMSHSMSQGIISALGREIEGIGGVKIHNMIQTDASINPGNSGGPLLNSSGEVIGMNTQIISNSGSSAGLGFAVPIDSIKSIVPELIKYGKMIRPQLGIKILNYEIKEGVVVGYVEPKGPAAKAGIRGIQVDRVGRQFLGDIIIAIDTHQIKTYDDLFHTLSLYKPGDSVTIKFLRDEKEHTTKLTLGKGF